LLTGIKQQSLTRSRLNNHNFWLIFSSLFFSGWPHNKLLEKTLYLQVIDYDRFSRDDPIGETYLPLNEIDLSQSPLLWRFLQPCKDSRVRFICLLHVDMSESPVACKLYFTSMHTRRRLASPW
jgi:hypothetical protein